MPLWCIGCHRRAADKLMLYVRLITVIRAMSIAIAGQSVVTYSVISLHAQK